MDGERRAGVLVHPTSLPGAPGVGDAGDAAVAHLDWVRAAGLSIWQLLPLGPTAADGSPYSALSAFAGNPLLIAPRDLAERGWLAAEALDSAPALPEDRVDFALLGPWKDALVDRAHAGFARRATAEDRRRFAAFAEAERAWLDDWVLFAALRERSRGACWTSWDPELRDRAPAALARASRELASRLERHSFAQFALHEQWQRVREAARERGVTLLGDLPFYVAHDSADVRVHRQWFDLAPDGAPARVSGVPPDYFSAEGQLWGQPVLRWDRLAADGYRWWVERLRRALAWTDSVRLDHFRGYRAYWVVDAAEPTAAAGRWEPGPGRAPFEAAARELGRLPLLAEDLGEITDDVVALRRELGLPGMRVLQFGLAGGEPEHDPAHYARDVVAYTGTHDNDTSRGWFEALAPQDRRRVLERLAASPDDVVRRMIELLYASAADRVVVPLQDLLDLDGTARMNTPGVAAGNWRWRAGRAQLERADPSWLVAAGRATGRLL